MSDELWPKQPEPIKNDNPAIWDLVLEDMKHAKIPAGSEQEKVHLIMVEDFKRRDATGAAKYGVRLQPFNGRDALQDAYEESLDKIVYLRQAVYENDQVLITTQESEFFKAATLQIYYATLDLTLRLKFIIEKKKELNKNVVIIDPSHN
jgi:hypothetical protein